MGLDRSGGQLHLSLASASDSGGDAPKKLSAYGTSVSRAMERIYELSFEEELFCYHVRSVLIGEAAAEEGIEDMLGYICRSPVMRIDVPVYIVKDAEAAELISDSGDGSRGISEIMRNISAKQTLRGGSPACTSADVLRDMKRGGSALVCALELRDAAESGEDENSQSKTAALAGYAIIRDGRLCRYIDREDAPAAELLLSKPGIFNIEVNDSRGGRAVLEINEGSAAYTPVWQDGSLIGMNIRLSAEYSVLETAGHSALQNEEYADSLTAALERTLLERAERVLQSSASLKADFLGLARHAEFSDPTAFRALKGSFSDLLPGLEFQLSVSCRMRHTNDMKDI